MKTNFLLSQHCRCKAILEMIQECDKRMKDYRQRVEAIEKGLSPVPYDHKSWLFERWEITLAIKERLAKSYANTIVNIVSPFVNKTFDDLKIKLQTT